MLKNSILLCNTKYFEMKNPSQELSEIKSMMERSKRFLSLSGIAGIPVGLTALAGIAAINFTIHQSWNVWLLPETLNLSTIQLIWLGVITALMFGIAAIITWILSHKKVPTQKLASPPSKKFLEALAIPIAFGTVACLLFAKNELYAYIPGLSLLMYGLGMIQAAQHSFQELKRLGLALAVLGLVAFLAPTYSLILWAMGFGGLHILYGIWMHQKYDRKI